MADATQSLCASPVFKRPRLDFSAGNPGRGSSFDSLPPEEAFRDIPRHRKSTNEVTSSTDTQIDVNGDSGFHESPPTTNGIDSSSSATHNNINYGPFARNEPDSSNNEIEESLDYANENQPPDRDSDDNDAEDVASSLSDLSGLSDVSASNTDNITRPYLYVQRLMEIGKDPRDVLLEILPNDAMLPPNLSSNILWRLVLSAFREPPPRTKLPNINTMDDVVSLLRTCRKIIVLTGAGVSVSCGIPDFRSRNGVYARLSQDYPDLPDPSSMFDIGYFKKDPRPFFKFAKEIYPGEFQPSPSHHFIKLLEKQGKLLRNYTQNIDTLEHAAGIRRVITCHGSFATASCTNCYHKVDSEDIREEIFNQIIPYCKKCSSDRVDKPQMEKGIMKPDIVFFGEGLSDEFHESMAQDKDECDLLLVMGSSLKVRPVACMPGNFPPNVPQILINREPLNHLNFDVELLGDCDVVIGELCHRLSKDWKIENIEHGPLAEITTLPEPKHNFNQLRNATGMTPMTSFSNGTRDAALRPDTTSEAKPRTALPVATEEESNSCDYHGMSAIKLDDSQDCSSSEVPNNVSSPIVDECSTQMPPFEGYASPIREPISSRLPEKSYLFVKPNRYIFKGAEVYQASHPTANTPKVITHLPNFTLPLSDSSSLSSDDDEDFEGLAMPERELNNSQSAEGDQSSLSNSGDDQSSNTTSPCNNTSYRPDSTHFKLPKEDSS